MYSLNDQADHNRVEIPAFSSRFRQASKTIALLVAGFVMVVLCGWAFQIPGLTYIRPSLQSMKVNTALSFLCLSTALWFAGNDKRQRSRRMLGLLVLIIGGATLAEYAFHVK